MTTPSDLPAALDASRERLGLAARALEAFLTGSEDVFLDVGRRLGGLGDSARQLVSASTADGEAAPDGGESPVDQLQRAFDRLELHVGATRDAAAAGLEGLVKLLARAEEITSARDELENVPRTLRVLGMNLRIETARVLNGSAGLDSVASEVRRLADLVEPKFRAVVEQAGTLHATAASAREASQAILARQSGWSRDLLQDTRAALGSLREHALAQGALTAQAGNAAIQIKRDVDQVLVSLLAHDATRQVIEHVIEELAAFEADVEAASPGLDAEAWLGEAGALARLLAAQLTGGRERLVAAFRGIDAHLGALARRVDELGGEAGRLAGLGGDGSSLERVHAAVGQASAALRQHAAHGAEMAAAQQRVTATVRATVAHVRDLEQIAGAIKIIALNALVETERSGDSGRVLAVLARSIGGLATDVVRRTGEVSRTLQAIGQLAEGLGAGGAAEGEAATLTGALESLAARLGDGQAALRAGAEAVHRGSAVLQREVAAIADRLREQAEAAQRLTRLEQGLTRLAEAAERLASPEAATRLEGRRAAALGRYTMNAERDIHHRLSGRSPLPAAAASASGGGSGLGDNVELF
ncbi:MAG: methyl-accepting chemotaxis protein [Anaeromyxobacter sp.]